MGLAVPCLVVKLDFLGAAEVAAVKHHLIGGRALGLARECRGTCGAARALHVALHRFG